jgi:hypothetical protein
MKRDMDLIRSLLLDIEEAAVPMRGASYSEENMLLKFPDHDPNFVRAHLSLIQDAGLIQSAQYLGNQIDEVNMTWQGHEFLEEIRNDDVWNQTKSGAKQVGSFGIELIRDIAKGIIKKKIHDLSGVDVEL